ncbi:MAG: thiol reductant ABC exporter subunit CydC [Chloroflexi bacterium]|nr:MAG: thiol reductant ABC exporter subunit CydC [Chloroflexota bacterium]MBL1196452.1 thiol reductant ABC exporter subunit CydC [Chloroflexota bacterium]NOH13747.1 thiol reductant ABC exporter subunit CydC [Chloroflexota bacterium]
MKILQRLSALVFPFYRGMLLSIVIGAATIGSSVALMATSAYLISRAALQPSIAEIQTTIVAVRLFGITRGVFRYLERYVSHNVTFQILTHLRVWFYEVLEPVTPAAIQDRHSGDLLSRSTNDVDTLREFYLRVLAPPLVAAVIIIGVTFFMGTFDSSLAFTLAFFLLLVGVGIPVSTRWLAKAPQQSLIDLRSHIQTSIVDTVQGLADLSAYSQEDRYLNAVSDLNHNFRNAQKRVAVINALQAGLSNLSMYVAIWAVLLIGIMLVNAGSIDGVFLATLVLASLASFEAVLPLGQLSHPIDQSQAAGERLFEIADTPPAVVDQPVAAKINSSIENILFNNLSFRYSNHEPEVLRDISFELSRGQSLAVVGPSGAGKSTLINLLLRFWEVPEDSILLDGQDIRTFPQEEIRSLFSVVSQYSHLFNATIRDNLLVAQPSATVEDLIQATRLAEIDGFIQSLPQGNDTWIGEQGHLLSGGERQRLAIARALLLDRPYLLLDEPTANLDALTEQAILKTIHNNLGHKTILMITHRIVGLDNFDHIIVMDKGQIKQQGKHEELIGDDGLYRRMWSIQDK